MQKKLTHEKFSNAQTMKLISTGFEVYTIEEITEFLEINLPLNPDSIHVKICVHGERFWTLAKKFEKGIITATVDNVLVSTSKHGYRDKDEIIYLPCHVYDLYNSNEL